MKYLKKFNESISKPSRQIIEDICLELKDIGLDYEIWYDTDIHIEKLGINNKFKWEEVKDCVLRLKDYIGDYLIRIKFLTEYDDDYNDITFTDSDNLDSKTKIDGDIFLIKIICSSVFGD